MVKAKSTGNRAQKPASRGTTSSSASCVQVQLRVVAVELRCALSAIVVAVHALREQNADLDADIALVLQRAAGAPLHAGVEKLETLLLELEGKTSAGDRPTRECVH